MRGVRDRLSLRVLFLIAAGALLTPATATAHLRSGTVAVDFRARIFHANTSAYTARIFQSDRALDLAVKPGHAVELRGYIGEPVFRLDDAGLAINRASPTAAALRLIDKGDAVSAPGPRWLLKAGQHSVVWHDARTQGLPSGVERGRWRVPLLVDGTPMRLEGDLRRYPAPSLWPWLAVLAGVLTATPAPLLRGARRLTDALAIAAALAASGACLVLVTAFAFDSYASPGTWIEGVDSLVLLAIGIWALRRGPRQFHVAAAIGMGLVGLAVGLLEGAVFFHPIVLAILPATVVRVAAVVAIGAGIDAAALGAISYSIGGRPAPTPGRLTGTAAGP
jgi:hypothetical protein